MDASSRLVRDILECYAHATNVFSYVYEPNVHHVIIECVSIVTTLREYEKNRHFSNIIFDMKVKWMNVLRSSLIFIVLHVFLIPVLEWKVWKIC